LKTEFKIGLAFVTGFLLLYWGISFMKGEDVFGTQKKFYVVYDNTEGLMSTRPVTINGFQIGQVDDITFHPDFSGNLIVTIQVNDDFPITKGTVAKIYSASIMSEKSIELQPVKGAPLAQSGDTLVSDTERDLTQEVNRQLAPIKAKTEELLGTIDTVIGLASGFLDQRTSNNFKSTIESIEKTFQSVQASASEISSYLSDNKGVCDPVSENFQILSEELASNSSNISATIKNLESISDSLARAKLTETINNMERITARFDRLINEIETGDGAASKFINDEQVYANLKQATENLNRLLLDIKYNPNKYLHVSLFGSRTRYTEEEIQAIERDIQSKQED